jgi:PKD repeat protein
MFWRNRIYFLILLATHGKFYGHPAPSPQYSALNLCLGDTANFINQTRGGVTYRWILSSIDTVQDIIQPIDSAFTTDYAYFFNSAGQYEVTLFADNGHLTTLSRTVTISNTPSAWFDYLECSNEFVNMSTCADQYFWDFGDGDTSHSALPTHVFPDTGSFIVKLKVWKGILVDSSIATINIDVLGYANSSFTVQVVSNTITIGLVYPMSPGGKVSWELGDGTFVTDSTSFTYVYPDSTAEYWVKVFMSNECGLAFRETSIHIDMNPVSLEEQLAGLSIVKVHPNPAADRITIGNIDVSPRIVNIQGAAVSCPIVRLDGSGCEIDVREIPEGVYFLELHWLDKMEVRKIIVDR